jgi:hypothetical protein
MRGRKSGNVVRLRAGRADVKTWEAAARSNGLSLSEYIRRKLNNKPVKAQKRLREVEEAGELEAREHAEKEERERLQRIETTNKAMRARQERFDRAERLARAAGGVALWLSRMSAEEREKWVDMEGELLEMEQLVKEAKLAHARLANPEAAASLSSGPGPRTDQLEAQRYAADKAAQLERVGIIL